MMTGPLFGSVLWGAVGDFVVSRLSASVGPDQAASCVLTDHEQTWMGLPLSPRPSPLPSDEGGYAVG